MHQSQRIPSLLALAAALLLAGCAHSGAPATAAAGNSEVTALHALFDEAWERDLRESPVSASFLGDRRYNDRWGDFSAAALEASHQADIATLERLARIDRDALPENEQLNHDLFKREYENRIENYEHQSYLIPLNQRGGIQTANEMTESLRFTSVKDYADWVARLNAFGPYMDQTIAVMKRGIAAGRTQPRIINERILPQIEAQIVEDATASGFYDPFREFAEGIPAAEQQRLRNEALAAIRTVVVPAFERLAVFFRNEYLPASRPAVGIGSTPNGKDYYAMRARQYTTTDLTPEEIHQIGLREVERIRGEMQKVIVQVAFKGSFQEFLTFLRTDPQFYYKDPQELLEAYRALSKRIDPELVKLFGHLPRTPYGVIPIPDAIAPDTTTAYYMPPAADGSRPGYYYVNLYKPEVRPTYEMEALSVHEAVPGHHLQIAIQQELGKLPEFRRFGGFTAFTEGWGLYSESLGEDLGLYQDPYSKFGQLTYEMWRAVRLVVDTGMHYKGWTRERAIEFFKANAAKTEHDIINEIDRYIAWPGQALAYKIGELKIKELRARAEEALGEDFDIKAFHDTVLGAGALPLDILEQRIDAWIAAEKGRS